jgi:hypothetical protein
VKRKVARAVKRKPPCRLFVFHAREKPVALILRRGPARWYHLIAWRTDTDTFEHGAWFRGPQGDTWGGGGRFVGRREVAITGQCRHTHPDHPLAGLKVKEPPPGRMWSMSFLSRDVGSLDVEGAVEGGQAAGAEWSGRDLANNLIYTRAGCVFRRRGTDDIQLADFNNLTPDPQPAPDWARKALRRR